MAMASSPHNSNAANNGIRLVCAGLGRTGTYSLTEALELLHYKPYHFVATSHAATWTRVASGSASVDTVLDLIVNDGYDAVLENPCSDIYLDILQRYPEAKVILTVRDSPENFESSWKALMNTMVLTEQSFRWTFPSFFAWIPLFQQLKQIRYMMGTTHLQLEPGALTHGWRSESDGWLATQYERHNVHVQQHVSKKRLLVFNVKQGWKPLCDFLECNVPDGVLFPHSKTNDAAALLRLKRIFQITIYSWIPIAVGTFMGVVLYGRYLSESTNRLRVEL
jgi:hypothetical protein